MRHSWERATEGSEQRQVNRYRGLVSLQRLEEVGRALSYDLQKNGGPTDT